MYCRLRIVHVCACCQMCRLDMWLDMGSWVDTCNSIIPHNRKQLMLQHDGEVFVTVIDTN